MGVTFGLFSDLHYSQEGAEERGNSARTFGYMQEGMKRFAEKKVDFVVALGDNVQPSETHEMQYEQIKGLVTEWNSYRVPVHMVMGNHEFCQLSFAEIKEILQTDRTYYSFDLQGWRFVILDTTYNPDGSHFGEDNFDWRCGCVPEEELRWLEALLEEKKPTILFTHYNVYLDPAVESNEYEWYQIYNRDEVMEILKRSECVKAVFQGHHHTSENQMYQGIPCINIPSPERSDVFDPNDFPVVELTEEYILYNEYKLN